MTSFVSSRWLSGGHTSNRNRGRSNHESRLEMHPPKQVMSTSSGPVSNGTVKVLPEGLELQPGTEIAVEDKN